MNGPGVTLLDGSGGGDVEEIVTFRIIPARMGRRCDKCEGQRGHGNGILEVEWGAMVLVVCRRHAAADWAEPYAATKAAGGELIRPAYDTFGGVAL